MITSFDTKVVENGFIVEYTIKSNEDDYKYVSRIYPKSAQVVKAFKAFVKQLSVPKEVPAEDVPQQPLRV